MSINANNAALNEILEIINDLPEAGNGKEEVEKTVDIIKNGETVVTPDDETTTLSKVMVNVSVPEQKEEQEKSIDITENGTTEVTPDEGKALSKVTVNVEVAQGGGGEVPKGVVWTEVDADGYPIKVDASSVKKTQNLFRYGDYVRTKEIVLPTNTPISTYYMCYYNTSLEKINLPTNVEYIEGKTIDSNCFIQCPSLTLSDWQIPEGITSISNSAFEGVTVLTDRIIPASVTEIRQKAFNRCTAMQNVLFLGTPSSIASNAFANCTSLTSIYVPWALDEVENAPWGATNATIHYNTTYDAEGNPQCPCHSSTEV